MNINTKQVFFVIVYFPMFYCARLGCSRGVDDEAEGGRKTAISAAGRNAPGERKHDQRNERLLKEG